MTVWQKFHSWNMGRKWNIAWKKGEKHIVFNEGGFYFHFQIEFAPYFYFRLFLSAGNRPLIFTFGLSPSERRSYESYKATINAR